MSELPDDRVWNRCFLGLAPAQADAPGLARLQAAAPSDAHRLAAADLHLTLAFFGRIAPAAGHALMASLDELAGAALALDLSRVSSWPSLARPRVLVAEFAPAPGLDALLARLHARMRALELPIEARPHRPHVTLARFPHRGEARAHEPPAPPAALTCRFDALVLYSSVAPAPGQRYGVLARAALRAPEGP